MGTKSPTPPLRGRRKKAQAMHSTSFWACIVMHIPPRLKSSLHPWLLRAMTSRVFRLVMVLMDRRTGLWRWVGMCVVCCVCCVDVWCVLCLLCWCLVCVVCIVLCVVWNALCVLCVCVVCLCCVLCIMCCVSCVVCVMYCVLCIVCCVL